MLVGRLDKKLPEYQILSLSLDALSLRLTFRFIYYSGQQKNSNQKIRMKISDLPSLNALLNLFSTICLTLGYIAIKRKKTETHKKFMISALVFSAFFLTGYLVYHYHHGSTKFPELGWIKTIYLIILIPHIILAAAMVPMIAFTFHYAFTGQFEKHKKIARLTFPIWMYVSVTGVIIFLMLYQWFKV